MRISRLFVPSSLAVGTSVSLTKDRAHYLRSVLRGRAGQTCHVFNGEGGEYVATIADINRHEVILDITRYLDNHRESQLHTHLGIGVVRSSAMDEALGHATELGATLITPLHCDFSQMSQRGNQAKRVEHWHQVIVSAAEQCGRNRLPELTPVTPVDGWDTTGADLRLFAHPETKTSLPQADQPHHVAIAIGPEGGFSPDEVDCLLDHGFSTVDLGPRILRTQTAVLSLLTQAQSRWGDMGSTGGERSKPAV